MKPILKSKNEIPRGKQENGLKFYNTRVSVVNGISDIMKFSQISSSRHLKLNRELKNHFTI